MTTTMREKLRLALGRAILDQLAPQKAMAFWNEAEVGGKISLAGDLEPAALVDAVLNTLREPDEETVLAGALAHHRSECHNSETAPPLWGNGLISAKHDVAAAYTAMIDHVKKG